MKHKILCILAVIIACVYVDKRLSAYFSPAKERIIYKTAQHHDDTLRIAYIGDSWAFGHLHFHSCQIPTLLENKLHRPIKVESYGIGGLTSKEIYHALFEIDCFRQFMEKGYDFCFISAGINDTYKKMSAAYYKTSMDCIIQFMFANDIRPIILEIPDYDIDRAYNMQRANRKLLRRASMLITDTKMDCKQDFRNALHELIQEKGYQDKVDVIHFKEWNNNYQNDLRTYYIADGMHLNQEGYLRLDSIIVRHILNRFSL